MSREGTKSKKGGAPRPVVLGDAIRDGKPLWAYCEACRHHAHVDPAKLARRLGYDAAIFDVRARMKCSRCGSREIDLRVDYGGPGVVAGHGPSQGGR